MILIYHILVVLSFLFGVSIFRHTMFRHGETFRLMAKSDTFESVKCFSDSVQGCTLYSIGVIRICMDSDSDLKK